MPHAQGVHLPYTTRRFLFSLVAFLILSFLGVSLSRNVHLGDAERANVILIVTDDQNADTLAFMPTLQRLLVAQGTNFTSAYAPTPLCCPGRATILRGQYAHNHGVKSNDGVNGGFPKFYTAGNEASTLATWFQDEGYRTALIGKYFNAYPEGLVPPERFTFPGERYIPPGWGEWFGLLDIPRDDYTNPYKMYDYRMNQNGRIVRYGDNPDDYLTDVLSGLAVDFLKDNVGKRDPFFLYLTPTAPHLPAIPALRHTDIFKGLKAPRPPSFNEFDLSDKPSWLINRRALTPEQVALLDESYRQQVQMLLAVDEMLAALIKTLRARGELASTYIMFTSDHGLHSGDHRLVSTKLTPYRASARVPLIVRGPGVAAARTVDSLALLSDVAPTLSDLVDVPTPAFIDGRSLVSWLGRRTSEEPTTRKQILHEFWPREGFPLDVREASTRPLTIPTYQALRSARYLYVEYRYPDGQQEKELYDLKRDPFELDNIAGRADAQLLNRLSVKLDKLQRCKAASCRREEDNPLSKVRAM